MMRRPSRELEPLRAAAGLGPDPQARLEARLRRSWFLVVGPALVPHTRLLRLARGVVVVGCWQPIIIPNLRASAEATWPAVQERLERLFNFKARAMEIVPCDPPAPEPASPPARDPDSLKAFLAHFRAPSKG